MSDYTPTTWVDNVTPVNATNLNKMEGGIDTAHTEIGVLDGEVNALQLNPVVPAVVNGKWIKGVGGAMVWSDITIADVASLQTALDAKVDDTEKGAVSGVATLDSASRLVQKATVDKIYSVGQVEGNIPVVRSGVTVWEAPAVPVVPVTGYGITLPASPTDGQEYILVDSVTAPTFQWRFRYNAGSTSPYKWEFIGGPPAINLIAADEAAGGATFTDAPTPGPLFTLPREGDYDCEYRADAYNGGLAYIGLKIGAAATLNADSAGTRIDGGSSSQNSAMGIFQKSRVLSQPAATVLKVQYRSQSSSQYFSRQLFVTPVRVA